MSDGVPRDPMPTTSTRAAYGETLASLSIRDGDVLLWTYPGEEPDPERIAALKDALLDHAEITGRHIDRIVLLRQGERLDVLDEGQLHELRMAIDGALRRKAGGR